MKTQQLSELRIYREPFRSEFEKSWFYEQKTYFIMQTTVFAQERFLEMRMSFMRENSFLHNNIL